MVTCERSVMRVTGLRGVGFGVIGREEHACARFAGGETVLRHATRILRAGRVGVCVLAAVVLVSTAAARGEAWPQWGGPNQDFKCTSTGLADKWPEEGPKKLWTRELGEGYSAIVADEDRLYTMYFKGEEEIAVALDAKTGETVWEHKYVSPARSGHIKEFGVGPRGTPLLAGDRVYTIGVSGMMHCLNKADGKPVWSHDLWTEFEGTFLNHGYSSSPLAYKDTIIVFVGGEGHGIVALKAADGAVAWKKQDFKNSYSSPKLINVEGQDQLVCYMAAELAGIDPTNGELLWSVAQANQWQQNITLPIWGEGNVLFLTAAEVGSKAVKLTRNGEKTEVEEIWTTPKIRLHHNNAVGVGDYVYGTTGERSPCFFMAVNIRTGDIAWRQRGFAKANCIYADGKFIILDEDGNLCLATATPEKFTMIAKVPLLEKVAWTVPTLVGRTLYVRDQKQVMALDLG